MIMHGTWYKGPQLAHTHHTASVPASTGDYHQFRSYPSFVVTPYHENSVAFEKSFPSSASTPSLLVDGGSVAAFSGSSSGLVSNHLTVLSPTIKIEQIYGEPLSGGVEDYALNLVDCSVNESGQFKGKPIFKSKVIIMQLKTNAYYRPHFNISMSYPEHSGTGVLSRASHQCKSRRCCQIVFG
ncbi:zinc finger protein rotund-like [Haematobia irritans]|uniref:zinc finger protein rotund-like n=1 Tax=Haematobia irritans TaxID=7368 RepID=UPI003F500F80